MKSGFLDTFARVFADLIYPVDCALCLTPRYSLCPDCESGLARGAPQPSRLMAELPVPLVIASSAHGEIVAVLQRFKDHGQTALARPLGRLLRDAIVHCLGDVPADCVVVVAPNAHGAFERRGFYPVPLMLRRAGITSRRWLAHRGRAADQRGLSADSRRRNLVHSMVAHPALAGRRVILVDDVVTTGSTVTECVRALTAAGAAVLCVIALTAVPRKYS